MQYNIITLQELYCQYMHIQLIQLVRT